MNRRFITFIAICFVATSSWVGAESFLKKYKNQPIAVFNQTGSKGGKGQKMFLIKKDRKQLIFRYQLRSKQEIGVPFKTKGLKLYYEYPKEFKQARAALRRKDYDEALDLLRPIVYPMVRYVELPPQKFNIREGIELLTEVVVRTENYDEALELIDALPITKLPPAFLAHSFYLADQLVQSGRSRDALSIISKIPLSKEQEKFIPDVMRFGEQLLHAQQIDEALLLFNRIQNIKGVPEANMAKLWTAYCNVSLGKLESAKIFLERASANISQDSKQFSLMELIHARIAIGNDDYVTAIEHVSKGVVYSDVSDSWAPELLYLSGLSYQRLNNINSAKQIYGEVRLLYPQSNWATLSKEELDEIASDS